MPPTGKWQYLMPNTEEELFNVPLHNFTSDADVVIFDDRLFLRRLDDVDKDGLRLPYTGAESSFVAVVTDRIIKNWTHCVSVRWTDGVAVPDHDRLLTAFGRMNAVVTALHVLHAGQVALPLNYSWQRNVKRVTAGTLIRMLPFQKSPAYHLGAGELESLQALLVAHEATTERGYCLATRRLDLSYDRLQEEDRLIDFWIALEALFAPDGRRGEIRYKVSRRIAFGLSDERANRLRIADVVKRSYDARSRIVHGDSIANLKSIVDETEEMLRAALRWWLEREGSRNPNKVVETIDDKMFGNPDDAASSGQ